MFKIEFQLRIFALFQNDLYTECKYGGPLGRRPGRVMKVTGVTWKAVRKRDLRISSSTSRRRRQKE